MHKPSPRESDGEFLLFFFSREAATSNFKMDLIDQACTTLRRDLSSRCTNGLGCTVSVEVHTTDKISVERYRSWSEWTWDHDPEWSAIESD